VPSLQIVPEAVLWVSGSSFGKIVLSTARDLEQLSRGAGIEQSIDCKNSTDTHPRASPALLLAIKRKGADTSILLQNIVQRTGVKVQFFLNAPAIKNYKSNTKSWRYITARGGGCKAGEGDGAIKALFLTRLPEQDECYICWNNTEEIGYCWYEATTVGGAFLT